MSETAVSGTAHAQRAASPLPQNGWAVLDDRVVARITGPGTDKFLQGQFSQNLTEVVPGFSPRAAAATPKGRAYCLTRLVRDGEDILAEFPTALAEGTINHLKKYLMLFRGTSMTVLEDASIVGILGSRVADTLLPDALGQLPNPGDSRALESGVLIRTQSTGEDLPRFEFWQTAGTGPELPASLRVSPIDWQASEIAAGVASLTPATREAFVPQMLNWQHVGGVHFKKGCYTGQEVIARMHFLGQLKKSLFRLRSDRLDAVPEPGSALHTGDRAVGEVVNAVGFDDGSVELLAVVRHDAANANLRLEQQPEAELRFMPLPYSVPEREKTAPSDT